MLRSVLILIWIAAVVPVSAAEPEGLDALRRTIDDIPLFDTHEHLSPITDLQGRDRLDFRLLFEPYVVDTMRSAGMPMALYEQAIQPGLEAKERFRLFAPYWEASRNTAAARLAEIAARDLYGVPRIDVDSIQLLSRRMNKAYKQGDAIDEALKKAGIERVVLDMGSRSPPAGGRFLHAERFEEFVHVHDYGHMQRMASAQGAKLGDLDDYVEALDKAFAGGLARRMVAVKSALGYHRPLDYRPASKAAAAQVFAMLKEHKDKDFPLKAVRPLQDFMMFHLLGLCQKHKLPVQIHTGLLTGSGKPVARSNPALLTGLFDRFPGVDFCLLHGSYPFGGQLAVVVKNHANAYLDLSWLLGLSPAYAARYLDEWLDLVPGNKILAFGGDAIHVEWTYAQAGMMRDLVFQVLSGRMRQGLLDLEQAQRLAKGLLRDNARAFFRVDGLLPLHRRPPPKLKTIKPAK